MYTEEYERRGFPIGNFLLKLFLVIIFVLLLLWLLPKFLAPAIASNLNKTNNTNVVSDGKNCPSTKCDTKGIDALTSQIFQDNIDKMKEAAIKYYTDERLPKEVGDSDTMTLSDMIGKKLIIALIDKNNKACDVEKSYVKITKLDEEYILKVNLKDSEKEDYILVHLGCYNYCEAGICQKQGTETPVKGSKSTTYVPIKGSIEKGDYIPPQKPTPVITTPKCAVRGNTYYGSYGDIVSKEIYEKQCTKPTEDRHYCVYYNYRYYDAHGNVVSEEAFHKSCGSEDKHYCVYFDNNYYDKYGNIVNEDIFRKSCMPEDKHYCVYYNDNFYNNKGKIVSEEEFRKACMPEEKHYCVYYNNKFYDKYGNIVSENAFRKSCMPEDKHYCVIYNHKYYDAKGNIVTEEEYKKSCGIEEKHYCVKYDNKYYDKNGNVVSEAEYKESCEVEEKHYCTKYNGKYYGSKGTVVTKEEYKKQCESDKEYIYEYKKSVAAEYSKWSLWSNWNKTSCATQEINCYDEDPTCLLKLQMLKRKEKIGTYENVYARTRQMQVQTGSYEEKACAKYNYLVINNTIYATKTTTTYTQINTITATTRRTVGEWVYKGRQQYSNPPSSTAGTKYIFAGANFSNCEETCQTLPDYYYDVYEYGGELNNVSTVTTPGKITSTSTTEDVSSTTTTTEASCGEIVTKTIPIYRTVTVTEKVKRTEPLYGDICYQSTKTREIISSAHTETKWSTYNDKTLLENGWSYTGNKKVK